MKNGYDLYGHVTIEKNGVVVLEQKNMVVDNGLKAVQARLFGDTVPAVRYMGVGSGTAPTTAGMTELGAPLALAGGGFRKQFDSTPTQVNNVTTAVTTLGPGDATGNINEAGLFYNTTGVALYARLLLATQIIKGANDTIKITWVITATRA
ncbi:hypothetical protein RU58_00055 [Achromobacter phage phiAxp-1]|uniref:hypothetical protein n=1 Tax=Achromobacter phage phiAxp-1 TaxID=1610509 RepID=UPI000655660D|nr:hypothetical protein RU58_00055 [Achromobacter phage phiAxp-1]QDH84374.1 putative DNA transfer protein [Achromobacter phage vB_AxyS_19-32_Axy18]QDH84440.1 putative DNA transfer protein [Achromobacter phage vB_AxyS_19-32_Axy19]QDH84505.1 putative DNA transfer protein [Achromobacter phage vB_AxyS_19-32_Axy20]WNO48601.1 hypothetical protein [Achromobacter phage shaaii_LB5]AKJ71380.1 hypothetical protein RU58_00055 [Achromobacter phage phiAxp-1]